MPTGRPTKLTDDIQETICKHVAAGVSYADAARLAGVSESALQALAGQRQDGAQRAISHYFGCMSRPPWRSSDPTPRT